MTYPFVKMSGGSDPRFFLLVLQGLNDLLPVDPYDLYQYDHIGKQGQRHGRYDEIISAYSYMINIISIDPAGKAPCGYWNADH